MTRTLISSCLLCLAGSAFAYDEYRLDDGVPEQNIGLSGGGSGTRQIAVLNRFFVEPGAEVVTGLTVAFGNIPNGQLVDLHVWYDANQTGDPSDAISMASMTDVTYNANMALPIGKAYYDLPDTTFVPGDIIYAGFIIEITPNEQPGRIDIDGSDQPVITYPANNHSFIAGDTVSSINPNALGLAQLPVVPVSTAFGFDGTWIIRLDADPLFHPCVADIDGDGVVNGADLAVLLASWNSGVIDLNGDGATDAADLAILLASWGPCP